LAQRNILAALTEKNAEYAEVRRKVGRSNNPPYFLFCTSEVFNNLLDKIRSQKVSVLA
jgi:hypothetical protein